MNENTTTLLVIVLLAFLFFSGTLTLNGTPFNQRPIATPSPNAGGLPNSQLGAAGTAAGVDLVTGHYGEAAATAYNAVAGTPQKRHTLGNAFKAAASVPAEAASGLASLANKLNPF